MEVPSVKMVSDALSTITIVSCAFLKMPQIMHMREKKSADGIHVQAMLLEIMSFTITTLYNFTNRYSIITYLEYPIILLQIYVMLYLVLHYKRLLRRKIVPLAVMFYLAFILGFALELVPKDCLGYLQPLCTPLSGFAKVTYIYGIISAANADAVSLSTWLISVLTNLARLFTVYVDSEDMRLMGNFTVSAILSSGVLITAMYYQARPGQPPTKRRKSFKGSRERKPSLVHSNGN